ncbi:hypothetical protein C6P45_001439 [Maudiozyma exigua]|uniref:HTH APSES-type domain-containing protein n=1 Tax=Maudiozyma exigua TaxID=34358 RepID=A0A9P6W2X9_MAUEX|nr:hypothetical protein C6P45_001439 [Kazachstania exigua]
MSQNDRDGRLQQPGMNVHYPTINEESQQHPLTYYYYNNNPGTSTTPIPMMQIPQYYQPNVATNNTTPNVPTTNGSIMPLLERPLSDNANNNSSNNTNSLLQQRRLEDNKSTNTSSILSGQSLAGSLGIDGMTTDSISRSTSPAFATKLGPSTYTYPGFQQQQQQQQQQQAQAQQQQTQTPTQLVHPVPTSSRNTTTHPIQFSSTPPLQSRETHSRESHHSNPLVHSPKLARADWDISQQNMGVIQSFDIVSETGQHVPRVTTTMWEDENTLCYQVKANGVSVVRRADNDMINGTKLLNVTKMTRGKRDGILKAEKIRHVVKIGSMHLKGVWIPFERALVMAEREQIVGLLYPLFVRDIERVLRGVERPPSETTSRTSHSLNNGPGPILSRPASRSATAASNYQPIPTSHTPVSVIPTNSTSTTMATGQFPMHMHMPLPLPLPLPPVSMSTAQLPLALSMQTALPQATGTSSTPNALHGTTSLSPLSNNANGTNNSIPPLTATQQLHLQQLHTQQMLQQQQQQQQQQQHVHPQHQHQIPQHALLQQPQAQSQVQAQYNHTLTTNSSTIPQRTNTATPLSATSGTTTPLPPQQLIRNIGQISVGIRLPQPPNTNQAVNGNLSN